MPRPNSESDRLISILLLFALQTQTIYHNTADKQCLQLARSCSLTVTLLGVEPTTLELQVHKPEPTVGAFT